MTVIGTDVLLFANGDLRLSANQNCWPAQAALEQGLAEAFAAEGRQLVRAHPFKPEVGHGFLASQREGLDAFKDIDPDQPIVVAEAVWQYSHHILPGLMSHRGPILTVANWSGEWPGLVGMLNLNGSLTKAGRSYSTLWSVDFTDDFFKSGLRQWLETGIVPHDESHVRPLSSETVPADIEEVAQTIAEDIIKRKVIMGVFDEGCMGMYNAILPDDLAAKAGFFKERLSQSTLYHATLEVADEEADAVLAWLKKKGVDFHFGTDEASELTEAQVLLQCKMYIAAARLSEEFGCDTIGIQYQQGLKDLLPASDLAEGMLNNVDRPAVIGKAGTPIRDGDAIPHFNEVDECAGMDAVLTNRVNSALGEPVETTLHDLRWGDEDLSGTVEDFVWVFEISGAAPPAHYVGGWAGASSMRQPPMYFGLGGGSLRGVSKPGEIVWSRIFIADNALHMDIGRGHVVALPEAETERRLRATTYEWPIMHVVTHGVSRDQMMGRHKANHIQVAYANSADDALKALLAKAALADKLGLIVHLCGEIS